MTRDSLSSPSMNTDSSLRKVGDSKTNSMEESKESLVDPVNILISSNPNSLHSSRSKKMKFARTPLFCSCRLILTVVSCLGFVNMYIMRFNLSVAMSWMVNSTAVREIKRMEHHGIPIGASTLRPKTCRATDEYQDETLLEITKPERGEFVWSAKVQSLLSSSFFWGYLVTQIPGGWLSERYGGKIFIGFAVLGTGIANLLIPYAARFSYKALIVIRVIVGFIQGVCWPAMNVIWSRWAPPLERQKLTSLCYTGSLLGMVITFPTTAMLCNPEFGDGWPSVFYGTGALGIAWSFLWYYYVYDSPELHPRISDDEKAYICFSLKDTVSMYLRNHAPTPWLSILTSKAVWGLTIVHTLANFTLYTLITNISKYMHYALYFDIEQTGTISAIPYIGFFTISVISGVIFDTAVARKRVSRTTARKIGNTIGTLIPGILVFCASFYDCTNRMTPLLLLIICISICGFQYGSGFITSVIDIAPQHAGVVFGISNTAATLSGIIAPLFANKVISDNLPSEWQTLLKVVAVNFIAAAFVFVSLGSSDIQEWSVYVSDDDDDSDTSPEQKEKTTSKYEN